MSTSIIYNLLSWNQEKRLYIFNEEQGATATFTKTDEWIRKMRDGHPYSSDRYACCLVEIDINGKLKVVNQFVSPNRQEASVIFLNPHNYNISVTNKAYNTNKDQRYSAQDMEHELLIYDDKFGSDIHAGFRLSGHYKNSANDNKLVLTIDTTMRDVEPNTADSSMYTLLRRDNYLQSEGATSSNVLVTQDGIAHFTDDRADLHINRVNRKYDVRGERTFAVTYITKIYYPPPVETSMRIYLDGLSRNFAFSTTSNAAYKPYLRRFREIQVEVYSLLCATPCRPYEFCAGVCMNNNCRACPTTCTFRTATPSDPQDQVYDNKFWYCPAQPTPEPNPTPTPDPGPGPGPGPEPIPPLPDPGTPPTPEPSPEDGISTTTIIIISVTAGIVILLAIGLFFIIT